MSTLLFGNLSDGSIPPDEVAIRRNSQPVRMDDKPAEQQGAPEFNELETDTNPEVGLGGRQLASDWHESEQYKPNHVEEFDLQVESNQRVNRQVSSSGTAADKELTGEWGHGTMSYAYGIEPTIRDGAAFGNDYFVASEREGFNPNSSSKDGLQPNQAGQDDVSAVAGYGKDAARDAGAAATYASWYAQILGGSGE